MTSEPIELIIALAERELRERTVELSALQAKESRQKARLESLKESLSSEKRATAHALAEGTLRGGRLDATMRNIHSLERTIADESSELRSLSERLAEVRQEVAQATQRLNAVKEQDQSLSRAATGQREQRMQHDQDEEVAMRDGQASTGEGAE